MTKFILVGGYPRGAADGGKAFCESLAKGFFKPAKILECLFSRPINDWEGSFQQDVEFFSKFLGQENVHLKMATLENFEKELEWADAVYFRGGETDLLIERLSKYPEWRNKLDGKTVAGSSAGAYMLSKYYFDIVNFGIKEGLGLVEAKSIVHWKSETYQNLNWELALEDLRAHKASLPTYHLAEGEFVEVDH
jgi:peptidase E